MSRELMESVAVGSHTGNEAQAIFNNILATNGLEMVFSHEPSAAPAPAAPGQAASAAPGMAAGGQSQGRGTATGSHGGAPVVEEYEVFKNDMDALSFFLHRQSILDLNAPEGPFWFYVDNGDIVAGTENGYDRFQNISPDVVLIAQQRGVITLVEFEEQEPFRVTPCYYAPNGF